MPYEVSCTHCGSTQIYKPRKDKIPKKPHTTCKKCSKDFNINFETSEKISKVPKNNKSTVKNKKAPSTPHRTDDNKIIEDPNELLMSVAVRELNKQEPNVRWATILVNILKETKQLEAISIAKSEVQSKLKQYSTEDLIRLRKKLTGSLQTDG